MCYQCTTDMLNVYSKTQNDIHVYMGIVRREYPGFERGDVFIGRQNDPDLTIKTHLFTWHDYEESFREEDVQMTPAQEAADRLFDTENLDKHFFWDEHLTSYSPDYIASAAAKYQKHFDFSSEKTRSLTAALVTEAAQCFLELGIPLSRKGRLEWADQFSESVDYITCQDDGSFLISRLGEQGAEEIAWKPTTRLPDKFRGYKDGR